MFYELNQLIFLFLRNVIQTWLISIFQPPGGYLLRPSAAGIQPTCIAVLLRPSSRTFSSRAPGVHFLKNVKLNISLNH